MTQQANPSSSTNSYGTLYLIPNTLGGEDFNLVIPPAVREIVIHLRHFIVENEKEARRFLKMAGILTPQAELKIIEIEKHNPNESQKKLASFLFDGNHTGLLSDAGSPAIADPGAEIIRYAHQNNIKVVPLTGPSSLLLALAGSGLNGQHFCFHGYLPVNKAEKIAKIRQLEKDSKQKKQTQLFIETPYRNNALLTDILQSCASHTLLCVACDLTMPSETIRTMPVSLWKKTSIDLHKRPTVFLLLQP